MEFRVAIIIFLKVKPSYFGVTSSDQPLPSKEQ